LAARRFRFTASRGADSTPRIGSFVDTSFKMCDFSVQAAGDTPVPHGLMSLCLISISRSNSTNL
jgi:hypothetical protein